MPSEVSLFLEKIEKDPELARKLYEILRDRFATVEQFDRLLEEIQKSREEADRRFEAMDRRFEAMERRFETMQKQMDSRFETMQKQIDSRFEAFQVQMNKRFDEQFTAIKYLSVFVTRIENKEGEFLEKTILELMKETLALQNIDPGKIRREKLSDPEGKVFPSNYKTDIDVILEDGNTYLVEVKATASSQDLYHFLQNVKLYELTHATKVTKPIVVTLRLSRQTYKQAEDLGIKIIMGEFID